MNTGQLECFLAVAENLNFARAAEYLHITQPAVTHQINSLEAELGRTLFKRTTRSVSLTIDGFRFLPDAKKISEDIHLAQARLHHTGPSEQTPFSIGCNNRFELMFLPALLEEMKQEFLSFHPSIRILPTRAAENLLQNETLDVLFGFHAGRGSHQPGSFKELAKAPIVCALKKDHALALSAHPPFRLEDIKKEPLVVLEPPKTLPEIWEIQNLLIPDHSPSDIYPCDSSDTALTLTRAGIGIMLIPDIAPLRVPDLAYMPLESAPSVAYGIYYKTKKDKPLIRKFLSIAEVYFNNYSGQSC